MEEHKMKSYKCQPDPNLKYLKFHCIMGHVTTTTKKKKCNLVIKTTNGAILRGNKSVMVYLKTSTKKLTK